MIESVDIKDISGNIRFSTPINEGSKRKFLLMKEDYITLKFSLDEPVQFKLGDNVELLNDYTSLFEVVSLQKPIYNTLTGGYDYELQLDAYYWKWKNKKFFFTPEAGSREAGWNLTDSLETHMNVFLKNLSALGYKYKDQEFTCIIDDTVDTSSKLISYDNVNLIDALNQMAETFECEWWVIRNEIHFGRCEDGEPIDFELGVNVQSMSRSDSQTTYATRIYAFGSTRNIPSSYRKKLIFDVKTVNGRDIADTSRVLDACYFSASSINKEEHKVSESIGSGAFRDDYTEWTHFTPLATVMNFGSYKVISEGVFFTVSTAVPSMGENRKYLPPGDYILQVSVFYDINGKSNATHLGRKVITLSQNQQYVIENKFTLPDNVKIEKGATNIRIRAYACAPAPSVSGWLSEYSAFVEYKATFLSGKSADTSVTFLSGVNEGKAYKAVYNPDLVVDEVNVLRLPEGVTASIGDRYTIDNIVKSKVPASYFSDDKASQTAEGIVAKHLMLPEGMSYIDAYPDMNPEEAVENIVVFDDIFPRREGVTSNITTHSYTDIIDNADGSKTELKWTAWRFKDADLGFHFSKDYRIDSEDLMVKFQSGPLAGMEFEVIFNPYDSASSDKPQSELLEDGTWNPKAQVYEIVRNDDYGRMLPDDVLHPSEGDKYVLFGYDPQFVSDALIPSAEKELLERAKEYMKKSKEDPSTYDNTMMSDYIYGINPDTGKQDEEFAKNFPIGQRVNLINKAYFVDGRISRIIGFEFNLDIPYDSPVYTVGETAPYSRIGELENKIDSITFKKEKSKSQSTGGSSSSASGEGIVKFPKNVEVTVDKAGYYKAGDVILAGTSVVDAFITMLSQTAKASLQGKISTANDVEYGTNKGYLTYTAVRNGQGKMEEAYYDDNPNNKLNFSEEVGGVQTATRQLEGVYTQSEKYTATVVYAANEEGTLPILKLDNKISVNVKRKWFAGVCSTIPQTSAEVRALGTSGLYNGAGTYKFQVGQWKMFVICIPTDTIKELTLTAYPGNFIEDKGVCSGPIEISVEGANNSEAIKYKMWTIQSIMINDSDTFTFRTV